MKIRIAAYVKGNPYKLLNSVDSEGKFSYLQTKKYFCYRTEKIWKPFLSVKQNCVVSKNYVQVCI